MRRRIAIALFVAAAVLPGAAGATIDTARCSSAAESTSAVEGYVKNVLGEPVVNAKVKIYATHFSTATAEATTDSLGFYWICAAHNTWVVQVNEQNPSTIYAEAVRTVTTFANTDRVDFTPESGSPLYYLANLTVAPIGVSSLAANPADRTWTFRFRTKAPVSKIGAVKIKLAHDGSEPTMTSAGLVNGWNVYTKAVTIDPLANDATYFANANGYDLALLNKITQLGKTSYFVDGRKPDIGAVCSSSNPPPDDFIPGTTTNPRPIITIGACDKAASGAGTGSGLDIYTATGKVCPTTSDCTPITSGSPTGNQCLWAISCQTFSPSVTSSRFLNWAPTQPFTLGTYYFRYSIRDRAGNLAETPTAYSFSVVETGGSLIVVGSITPSDGAVVIGCTCSTPISNPGVTFQMSDNDGQPDIELGSVRVQIRYLGEQTQALSGTPVGVLVYDYDPSQPATALNGGTILSLDTRRYQFVATGFRLQATANRLPGRYLVTATATDKGGNSDSIGWLFYHVSAV